jgi:ferredoxin-NADP reductase
MDYQSYEATITGIKEESPSVKSFDISLTGGDFDFLPGQYIDLFVDTPTGIIVGGYSIISAPVDYKNKISIAVKKIEGALATVQLHDKTLVGDMFHLQGPGGDFYYEPNLGSSIVFVAGGIGITPFISMIKHINKTEPNLKVALIASAKVPSELIFREEIIDISHHNLNINPIFTVTQPTEENWDGKIGRINRSTLSSFAADKSNVFLISGPDDMQENVESMLTDLGVLKRNIKRETW